MTESGLALREMVREVWRPQTQTKRFRAVRDVQQATAAAVAWWGHRESLLGAFPQLRHDLVEVEAGGLLPLWVLLERSQELGHISLRRDWHERVVEQPVVVCIRGDVPAFIRIRSKIENLWNTKSDERLRPYAERPGRPLLQENELPVVVSETGELLVIVDIKE